MASRDIIVTGGAVVYVGGTVTDVNGEDLTTATFMLSLGSRTNPGAWVAPSVSIAGDTSAERVLKLLVNNTTPLGTYYCWAKIVDAPETEAVKFPMELIIR